MSGAKRSDSRMQSRGKSTRKWKDVTMRYYCSVHPERGGPLLKRPGVGQEGGSRELPRSRLKRSSMEDTVSGQTEVSCCPIRMGLLAGEAPQSLVDMVDEFGP